MSILGRIKQSFKAKVNSKLDEIENPIELLDLQIKEREEKLSEAKLSASKVLGNNHLVEKKIKELKEEISTLEANVKKAMSKDQEELAKKILSKKLETEKNLKNLEVQFEQNQKIGNTLKTKLETLEKEINKLRDYRIQAEARLNTAEASQEVNKILANLDNSNGVGLDDIERKINNKEALAQGLEDIKINTLEEEMKSLDDDVNLEDELQKYK